MLNDPLFRPLEDIEYTTVTIQPGVTVPFAARGEFVRCLYASADIKISFNGGSQVIFGSGLARRAKPGQYYESFELYNDTSGPVSIEITYGFGNLEDGRLSLTGDLNVAVPTTLQTPSHPSINGGASGVILAANSSRNEALIRNPVTNTHNFLIGDSNVDATRGMTLQPGEGFILSTTSAIHAFNTKGTAQNIEVMEI